MINFLITTDLTSEQLDYVHTVQQSADALLLVINDILDLSKVEAGMMKLEMEPFSVHTMIEGANELLSTLAIQKGLELGFLVENEVPEVVIGDRVRLRQVLINIIGVSILRERINIECGVDSYTNICRLRFLTRTRSSLQPMAKYSLVAPLSPLRRMEIQKF